MQAEAQTSPLAGTGSARTRFAERALAFGGTLDRLAPIVDLAVRLFVAAVFFKSGMTKIANWPSTVSLFENVYAVPLLPPEPAALLATGVELVFPLLLAAGLGARLAAFVLFAFNAVAAISYPELSEVGLRDHQTWGLLLLVTLLHGPGALSLDRALARLFGAARSSRR